MFQKNRIHSADVYVERTQSQPEAIVLVMHDATPMENQVGLRKNETHEVVATLIRGNQRGGAAMRRAPVLSRPRTKGADGIISALGLQHSGIDLMCEADDI